MTRNCPGNCGKKILNADVLCPGCMGRVSNGTRTELRARWKAFQKAGRLGDMQSYQAAVDRAIREAQLAANAGRDVLR